MNSLVEILKKMIIKKKPKVFCLTHEKISNQVLIKKIPLIAVRNLKLEITHFENPSIKSILKNLQNPNL